MGLFDTLFGRTKPVAANLDDLFGLPSAAITLEASGGLAFTGRAGVAYKPPAGQASKDVQHEIEQLLSLSDDPSAAPPAQGSGVSVGSLTQKVDAYGYRWLLLEDPNVDDLVARVHLINTMLTEAGWGPQLLCSVFSLAPRSAGGGAGGSDDPDGGIPAETVVQRPLFLVYLYKRGTFYPFAPEGKERRDNEVELRVRGLLANDVKMEQDLSRWFPLWDLPLT